MSDIEKFIRKVEADRNTQEAARLEKQRIEKEEEHQREQAAADREFREHKGYFLPPYIDLNQVLQKYEIEKSLTMINQRYFASRGLILVGRNEEYEEGCFDVPGTYVSEHIGSVGGGHKDYFGWSGPVIMLIVPSEDNRSYKSMLVSAHNKSSASGTIKMYSKRGGHSELGLIETATNYKNDPQKTLYLQIGSARVSLAKYTASHKEKRENNYEFRTSHRCKPSCIVVRKNDNSIEAVHEKLAEYFIETRDRKPTSLVGANPFGWIPQNIRPDVVKMFKD